MFYLRCSGYKRRDYGFPNVTAVICPTFIGSATVSQCCMHHTAFAFLPRQFVFLCCKGYKCSRYVHIDEDDRDKIPIEGVFRPFARKLFSNWVQVVGWEGGGLLRWIWVTLEIFIKSDNILSAVSSAVCLDAASRFFSSHCHLSGGTLSSLENLLKTNMLTCFCNASEDKAPKIPIHILLTFKPFFFLLILHADN